MSPSWQGSFSELASVIQHIQYSRAQGRLSLRNAEVPGITHLYFYAGRLIQVISHHGDARAILNGLRTWNRAHLRFDNNVSAGEPDQNNDEYERLLMDVLAVLQRRGVVRVPVQNISSQRVIESNALVRPDVMQLISPLEWNVLVEGTRRISWAVARLVGPQEALAVLQDILDDCSASFPAFASLHIDPSGYLHVMDRSQLDHMSREDLLEGFSALFSICHFFCVPLIGEKEAHRLLVRTLPDLVPALMSLGVFRVDTDLLAQS